MTLTMSHLIRAIMLLFACLFLISACSDQTGTNRPLKNSESSTTSGNEIESASLGAGKSGGANDNLLETYTLKFVYTGSPQKDEEEIEAAINTYLLNKINAKIDLTPIDWGPWDDKINLMAASREKVDILFTAQWNKHAVNVSKGAFLEIDELLEQYGQGILQSLDSVFLAGAKIDGKYASHDISVFSKRLYE